MNKDTAKALEDSIKHWSRMTAKGRSGDDVPAADQCALCTRFNHWQEDTDDEDCVRESEDGIEYCPIKVATGHPTCWGTPYREAYDAYLFGTNAGFKKEARKMRDFLISLREVE